MIGATRERIGFACWSGNAFPMAAAHAHDEVEFNLSLDGPLHYLIGGRLASVPQRQLCLFWANTPHQLVNATSRVMWLTVPLQLFLAWRPDELLATRLLTGELVSTESGCVPRAAEVMARWTRDLAEPRPRKEIVSLEAQAMVRRLGSIPGAENESARGMTQSLSVAAAMASYISRHSGERLRVCDVAEAAHLSTSHAMETFKVNIGITIGRYLEQCRLAEAQRLLLATNLPVLEVARQAGFGSPARFHAVFKARTGSTPARYRRAAGALPAERQPDAARRSDPTAAAAMRNEV